MYADDIQFYGSFVAIDTNKISNESNEGRESDLVYSKLYCLSLIAKKPRSCFSVAFAFRFVKA